MSSPEKAFDAVMMSYKLHHANERQISFRFLVEKNFNGVTGQMSYQATVVAYKIGVRVNQWMSGDLPTPQKACDRTIKHFVSQGKKFWNTQIIS